ncbi:MAG: hypothetical protein J5840_06140 [Lachnospiraceae bacterium]|nr:hypothetical protein [Lachnospiraceae bacterium]
MKRIVSGIVALSSLLLLTGCSYSFNYSYSTKGDQPISAEIDPDEEVEIPKFSSFGVTCGDEDVTSRIDKEAMEKFVYYVYSADDFSSSAVDTMAILNDPANAPSGSFVMTALYPEPVKAGDFEVTEVYIIPDFEGNYLFQAGPTIVLNNLQTEAFVDLCNGK